MTCPSRPAHSQGLWAALSALGTPSEEAHEGRAACEWPVVSEGGGWGVRHGEPSSRSSKSHSCQPDVAVMVARFSFGPSIGTSNICCLVCGIYIKECQLFPGAGQPQLVQCKLTSHTSFPESVIVGHILFNMYRTCLDAQGITCRTPSYPTCHTVFKACTMSSDGLESYHKPFRSTPMSE